MKNIINRRQALRATALLGTLPLIGIPELQAAPQKGKTPPLSSQEIAAIEAAMGKKGTYKEAEATHTTALPRNDLKVKIKGEAVPISFGFGGWAAIKKTVDGKTAMLMSDTVLLQEEVNPLISAAHANGLEVSAIHNHFFYEEPRIFYMHLHGMGTPAELAKKFAATISQSKISPANQPKTTTAVGSAGDQRFYTPALDGIVGHKGTVNGPTYKYTVGREDLTIMAMGTELTPSIGLNSWASFAGDRDNAHVAGDIAMLEPEVNPVIAALRRNNLEVVALHNHMLGDDPRMIFLHYYGRGQARELAKGFRAALDELGRHGKAMNHKKH
ncbi:MULTISPECIES: DUF1259 domain-containing protein [Pontibacter]|uniref:DUF1259 domain-containing protein n=2 Tax=Pontibacter TaxID=323449 RepID=A0A5C8KDD7_9BACT|nr:MULTISPECIES: DUF1259 domain-containing protein [Pontibacter]PVY38342.1 uncharacterized protein DUF1259 [Pontibacter virosus]QCR25270.1 hypothetical protein C1N53_22380 [Pontibacter sp. SGAir0037]TXK50042.1 DUF1259 domain-containing protein [Pontibacter qinzhouensis]